MAPMTETSPPTPVTHRIMADERQSTQRSELKKNGESSKPVVSLEESLLQRVSTIKQGDNVLLRLPSDTVKAVVASKDG